MFSISWLKLFTLFLFTSNNFTKLSTRDLLTICRNLTELALLYCQRIGNLALLEVGRGCKSLQALHLVDCSSIGDDAICSIAEGCQNLKKLHIRRCYKVLSLSLSLTIAFVSLFVVPILPSQFVSTNMIPCQKYC